MLGESENMESLSRLIGRNSESRLSEPRALSDPAQNSHNSHTPTVRIQLSESKLKQSSPTSKLFLFFFRSSSFFILPSVTAPHSTPPVPGCCPAPAGKHHSWAKSMSMRELKRLWAGGMAVLSIGGKSRSIGCEKTGRFFDREPDKAGELSG